MLPNPVKKWLYTAIGTALMSVMPLASGADLKAGTYSCSATGNGGDVKLEVVIDTQSIKSIKIVDNKETKGVADAALTMLPASIIEHQSLAVDGISGATMTSKAIKTATKDCLTQASADISTFMVPVKKQATKKDQVTKKADVVIVGAGGAGMSAAYAAAKNGATVIVIEKMDMIGGNTIRSGGGFNATDLPRESKITLTEQQFATIKKLSSEEPKNDLHKQLMAQVRQQLAQYQDKGNTALFDSPEWHALQTYAAGDYAANLNLVYLLAQSAKQNIGYLEQLGLVWKDNTTTYVGALWPRSHQARDYTSGRGYIETFRISIEKEKLPVKILTQITADSLVVENNRVTGVKATGKDGTPYLFVAQKGVIIASGGFSANVEMRMKYDTQWGGKLDASVKTTNSPGITGDGIRMAEAINANLIDMGYIQIFPSADPQTGATSGYVGTGTSMMVNKQGKRFVNELERRDVLVKAILKQPDGMMYYITNDKNAELDANRANKYGEKIDDLIAMKKVFKGNTVAELAKAINIDPAVLEATIKQWNEMCTTQTDSEFGRNAFTDNVTLFEGPYYASPRAPSIHHTMGGLQINEQTQVLNKDGQPIAGLWAAGEVTGGIHGTNRVGANAIPDAISFGRIAGENASK